MLQVGKDSKSKAKQAAELFGLEDFGILYDVIGGHSSTGLDETFVWPSTP